MIPPGSPLRKGVSPPRTEGDSTGLQSALSCLFGHLSTDVESVEPVQVYRDEDKRLLDAVVDDPVEADHPSWVLLGVHGVLAGGYSVCFLCNL